MKTPLRYNLYFKIATLFVIGLILLIPSLMINGLISERESYQQSAITEVSSIWGEAQTLKGPYLCIPFYKYVRETTSKDSVEKVVRVKDYWYVLPDKVKISGSMKPQERHRGIYTIVVYASSMTVEGDFSGINPAQSDVQANQILWDKATLCVGLNDLRGIEKQVSLQWDQQTAFFNPGLETRDITESGINVPVSLTMDAEQEHHFKFQLDLKGSQQLYFTPVGKITDVDMLTEWPSTKFNGAFLPDERQKTQNGYKAHWNVLHLNRNFPQSWTGSKHSLEGTSFGIDLILPVDQYQKTYRAIHYAVLFIVLTFLIFFFIEVLNRSFIHPIQYILVGISLLVFFVLLLSISEHITFNLAYIISGLATLILIAGYVHAILKSRPLTFLITGILGILYTFIFVIIQLEDYALLFGSLGLFIILALVMYYSRKIDWYNLNTGLNDAADDNVIGKTKNIPPPPGN